MTWPPGGKSEWTGTLILCFVLRPRLLCNGWAITVFLSIGLAVRHYLRLLIFSGTNRFFCKKIDFFVTKSIFLQKNQFLSNKIDFGRKKSKSLQQNLRGGWFFWCSTGFSLFPLVFSLSLLIFLGFHWFFHCFHWFFHCLFWFFRCSTGFFSVSTVFSLSVLIFSGFHWFFHCFHWFFHCLFWFCWCSTGFFPVFTDFSLSVLWTASRFSLSRVRIFLKILGFLRRFQDFFDDFRIYTTTYQWWVGF